MYAPGAHSVGCEIAQVTNQIIKGVSEMVENFSSDYTTPYRGYNRCASLLQPCLTDTPMPSSCSTCARHGNAA